MVYDSVISDIRSGETRGVFFTYIVQCTVNRWSLSAPWKRGNQEVVQGKSGRNIPKLPNALNQSNICEL